VKPDSVPVASDLLMIRYYLTGIIFSVLIIGYSFESQADEVTPNLHIGVEGGGIGATFSRASSENTSDYLYRGRLAGGVTSRFEFARFKSMSFAFRTGLLYVSKGPNVEFEGRDQGAFTLTYLELPFFGVTAWQAAPSLTAFVAAGPYLGIALGAQSTGANGDVRDITDSIDPLDIGVGGALGATWDFGERFALVLEGRFAEGITDIDSTSDNPGRRNRSVLLMVGLDYEIWRAQATPTSP